MAVTFEAKTQDIELRPDQSPELLCRDSRLVHLLQYDTGELAQLATIARIGGGIEQLALKFTNKEGVDELVDVMFGHNDLVREAKGLPRQQFVNPFDLSDADIVNANGLRQQLPARVGAAFCEPFNRVDHGVGQVYDKRTNTWRPIYFGKNDTNEFFIHGYLRFLTHWLMDKQSLDDHAYATMRTLIGIAINEFPQGAYVDNKFVLSDSSFVEKREIVNLAGQPIPSAPGRHWSWLLGNARLEDLMLLTTTDKVYATDCRNVPTGKIVNDRTYVPVDKRFEGEFRVAGIEETFRYAIRLDGYKIDVTYHYDGRPAAILLDTKTRRALLISVHDDETPGMATWNDGDEQRFVLVAPIKHAHSIYAGQLSGPFRNRVLLPGEKMYTHHEFTAFRYEGLIFDTLRK